MSTKKKIPPVLVLATIALVALCRLYAIAGGPLPLTPGENAREIGLPLDANDQVTPAYPPAASVPSRLSNMTTMVIVCPTTSDLNNALARGNKNIRLEPAAYTTTAEILVRYPVKISGSGKAVTSMTQTSNYANIFRIMSGARGAEISGIAFNQTGKGDESNLPTSYDSGVAIYRADSCYIHDCAFNNSGDIVSPLTLSGNGMTKTGAGVYLSGGNNNRIVRNDFNSCIMGVNVDDYGNPSNVENFYVKDNTVSDNTFTDCWHSIDYDFGGSGGKDFEPGTISNNKFIKNYVGGTQWIAIIQALFQCPKGPAITGNTIKGAFDYGIQGYQGLQNATITHNVIDGCATGIQLSTGLNSPAMRNNIIALNTILNCSVKAIDLNNSMTETTVAENNIKSTPIGVNFHSTGWAAYGVKISDNTFFACRSGVYTNNSTLSMNNGFIRGNVFINTSTYDIDSKTPPYPYLNSFYVDGNVYSKGTHNWPSALNPEYVPWSSSGKNLLLGGNISLAGGNLIIDPYKKFTNSTTAYPYHNDFILYGDGSIPGTYASDMIFKTYYGHGYTNIGGWDFPSANGQYLAGRLSGEGDLTIAGSFIGDGSRLAGTLTNWSTTAAVAITGELGRAAISGHGTGLAGRGLDGTGNSFGVRGTCTGAGYGGWFSGGLGLYGSTILSGDNRFNGYLPGQLVNWAIADSHFSPRYRMMSSITTRSVYFAEKSTSPSSPWVRFGFPGGNDGPITYKSQRLANYSTDMTVRNNMLLTFGGYSTVTVAAKQVLYCDPIAAAIVAGNHYAVTGYQTAQAIQDIGAAFGTPHYYSQSQFEYGNVASVTRALVRNASNNNSDRRFCGPFMEVLTGNPAYTDTYYLFGDSIGQGAGSSGPDKSWAGLLGANANVHNASMTGWTIMQEAAIIANRTFNGMTPGKVIDALDSNDIMNYSGNGWTSETLDQINAAHLKVWNYWHNQGAKVLVTQTPPRAYSSNQATADSAKNDLNAWKYRCYDMGLVDGVIDMDTPLRGATPDSCNPSLFYDSPYTHPNDSGHAAMFTAIGSVNATMEAIKQLDTQAKVRWYVDGTNGYDVPGYGFLPGTPAKTAAFLTKYFGPRMHKATLAIAIAGSSPLYMFGGSYLGQEFTNNSTATGTYVLRDDMTFGIPASAPPADYANITGLAKHALPKSIFDGYTGQIKASQAAQNNAFNAYTSAPACYAGPTPPTNTQRYPYWYDTAHKVNHRWDGTGWYALDGHGDFTCYINQNWASDNVLTNSTTASTWAYAKKYLVPKTNTGATNVTFRNCSSQSLAFPAIQADGGVTYQGVWGTREALGSTTPTNRMGATSTTSISNGAWVPDGTVAGGLDDYLYFATDNAYRPIINAPTGGRYYCETAPSTATQNVSVLYHQTILKNCNITIDPAATNWTIKNLAMRGSGTGITYYGTNGTVNDCKFSGYTYGILTGGLNADGNIFSGCGGGIRMQGGQVAGSITNNNFVGGAFGLLSLYGGRIYLTGNRFSGQTTNAVANWLYVNGGTSNMPAATTLILGNGIASGYNSIVDCTGAWALDWEIPGTCGCYGMNGTGASSQLYGNNASSNNYRTFNDAHTPANNELGFPGFMFWDGGYGYICTSPSSWRRTTYSTY